MVVSARHGAFPQNPVAGERAAPKLRVTLTPRSGNNVKIRGSDEFPILKVERARLMKAHARVVVIGGGVVGVSTLYHLTKKGWSDVVLCERTELTAGSTWHAAGLLPLFNMSYAVGQLHKYSVDLYKGLEAETGQAVGFHVTGNLRLACNRDRMDEYLKYCGTANTIGVPFEMITPSEVKELWPLCNPDGLVGALYHPDDGHIAPVDLTNALAKGARNGGAEIYQNTAVTAIGQQPSGEWQVTTE